MASESSHQSQASSLHSPESELSPPLIQRGTGMTHLTFKSTSEDMSKPQEKEHVYIADSFSPSRQILFTATVCMAMFTNQLGLGQPIDIIHIIGDWYHLTNPGDLSWLVAGYSLTIGTFILMGGRFGDDFGHKKMFVIGLSWYALWTLVAGLAVWSNHVLFVFARVFQGMGPVVVEA